MVTKCHGTFIASRYARSKPQSPTLPGSLDHLVTIEAARPRLDDGFWARGDAVQAAELVASP
jgi:hypothetical protein